MYATPAIDAHLHLTEKGDWISRGYDASLDRLMEEMDRAEVEKGLILSLATLGQNDYIREVCEKSDGRLYALTGYDPDNGGLDRLRDELASPCVKGIKIHPRMDGFTPNDERLYPLYEEAAEKGWPINFDAMAHSGTIPMEEIRPTAFDRLAKRFPDLTMVLSHSGAPWVMEAFFVAKSNPHVYLDCSFILDRFKGTSIHTDLLYAAQHLDRKMIYGSDFPERSVNRYLSMTRAAFTHLSAEKLQNIFAKNARKVYGLND